MDKTDLTMTILSVIILAFVLIIIGVALVKEVTNPCLEWEYTGGMSCYNNGSFTNCQQTKECVRRQK